MKNFTIIPKKKKNGESVNLFHAWEHYIPRLQQEADSLKFYLEYYHKRYQVLNLPLLPEDNVYTDKELIEKGYLKTYRLKNEETGEIESVVTEELGDSTIKIFCPFKLKFREGLFNSFQKAYLSYNSNNPTNLSQLELFEPQFIIFQNFRSEAQDEMNFINDNINNSAYSILPRYVTDVYTVAISNGKNIKYELLRNSLDTFGTDIKLGFEIFPRRYNNSGPLIPGKRGIINIKDDEGSSWSGAFPVQQVIIAESKENKDGVETIVYDDFIVDTENQILATNQKLNYTINTKVKTEEKQNFDTYKVKYYLF